MKITITDSNRTLTLENSEPLTPQATRKVIDILFDVSSQEQEQEQVQRVTCPTDPVRFRGWLTEHPANIILDALNREVKADLTQPGNCHRLIRQVPQVSKLGYPRFVSLMKWLHFQRLVVTLPEQESLRTYYTKAVRLLK